MKEMPLAEGPESYAYANLEQHSTNKLQMAQRQLHEDYGVSQYF